MNYKFGNKNNWRRWVWNRIDERLTVPKKDAVILYLAGKDNIDRDVALFHGFKSDNLIAIEKDMDAIRELRKKGALCINGDIIETASNWPLRIPVHVLLLDFCHGLTNKVLGDIPLLSILHPSFMETIIVINMLRGRDSQSNVVRKWWIDHWCKAGYEYSDILHRGRLFASEFMLWNRMAYLNALQYKDNSWQGVASIANQTMLKLSKESSMSLEDYNLLLLKMDNNAMRAAFNQYKSTSNQIFDSAVICPILPSINRSTFEKYREFKITECIKMKRTSNVVHKISAILAHRTMRLNG